MNGQGTEDHSRSHPNRTEQQSPNLNIWVVSLTSLYLWVFLMEIKKRNNLITNIIMNIIDYKVDLAGVIGQKMKKGFSEIKTANPSIWR